MIAFDSDVLSDYLRDDAAVVRRVHAVPAMEQFVPIVVLEEIFRGRLHAIRRAEARANNPALLQTAYWYLADTIRRTRNFQILLYSPAAETLVQDWRLQRIRVGSRDMRIAAIAVAAGATLVTRNRRDFDLIPGLQLDCWT